MSRLLIITALVFELTMLASGSAQAEEAKVLFDFYCAQCHGFTGKGDGPNVTEDFKTDPRNFTNAAEMEKRSDSDLRTAIADGGAAVSKSELMPPWRKTIAAADIDKLVVYIRDFCKCKGK